VWIEDDEYGPFWWAAAGWAELLVEQASLDRGPRERAARDTAALLIYQASLTRQCRTGLVQLATVHQLLTAGDLTAMLREVLTDPVHQYAAGYLSEGIDLATGTGYLLPVVTTALDRWPASTPLEDLWPATTLLSRGGGGPNW
jgi:hypothetical protein